MKVKIKNLCIDFVVASCYLLILHFIAINETISGLVLSIIFDIVIAGFFIEVKKGQEQSVLKRLCEKNNWFFNEDFFELYYSIYEKRIRLFVYLLAGIVPFSNVLFEKFSKGKIDAANEGSELLEKAEPLFEHIIWEVLIVCVILVVWAAFISFEKQSKKCYSLHTERKSRTGQPFDSLDDKYKLFIGEYSDKEIEILNGGSLPALTARSQGSNP